MTEETSEYERRESGRDEVVGQTIVDMRPMTDEEREVHGWGDGYGSCEADVVLVLSNGVVLYPSRDEEGNGGGSLFAAGALGDFYVYSADVRVK